ncbi:hypothetical protein NPX13_g8877 [Xylaria arbuscula]|uniref:Uncharacterized protein n=1 Tax=Xylaria arbuscula TaxID=114810 RepID=A0A9W8N7F2_9PEZI|nr:hypothetical protein NPX13_g8877 [Xylaria arbuscula]
MGDTSMPGSGAAASSTRDATSNGSFSSGLSSLAPTTSTTSQSSFSANQSKNGTPMASQSSLTPGAATAITAGGAAAVDVGAVTTPIKPALPALPAFPASQAPSQPTDIQQRNRKYLDAINSRLQNFSGSPTDLLKVANVLQQLDSAFGDLEYAQMELEEVLIQYQADGYISNRQNSKRHGAIADMHRAIQWMGQSMNQLWNIQKRQKTDY